METTISGTLTLRLKNRCGGDRMADRSAPAPAVGHGIARTLLVFELPN
jgi:hypothetical protein